MWLYGNFVVYSSMHNFPIPRLSWHILWSSRQSDKSKASLFKNIAIRYISTSNFFKCNYKIVITLRFRSQRLKSTSDCKVFILQVLYKRMVFCLLVETSLLFCRRFVSLRCWYYLCMLAYHYIGLVLWFINWHNSILYDFWIVFSILINYFTIN